MVSNGSLYDINGNLLEPLSGRLLTVQNGEVTTLLGKQVNIVSLKGKISKELWGFEKEELPTLWVMARGERTMVQSKTNTILLTSKGISKEIAVNSPIVGVFRGSGYLVFVTQREFGKISLNSF